MRHYAEFLAMPNCFLRIRRKQDESAGTPFRSSAPCGIVRDGSQVLEETQQLIIGPVISSLTFDGCSLRQHLLFQSKVGIEVDLSGLDRFVTQPECNERTIHSRLQQLHCCCVSKHMW